MPRKKVQVSDGRNEEPSTQQDSSSSSYFAVCENLPDSKNIKVAGATFLYRTESGNYHYWYCLYSRRKPKCCKAACRREIGSKDKTKVEFIAPHSTDPQAPCPFMAQASDYEVIQNQVTSGLAKEAVEAKLLNLLKENLGWSIQELKDHCYLNNIDISALSTSGLQNLLRTHKKENNQRGIALIFENCKTISGQIYLREVCTYYINHRNKEIMLNYFIWASPAQIGRLRSAENW